jgi:Mn2+/Fe2+ NRAMP family transporter
MTKATNFKLGLSISMLVFIKLFAIALLAFLGTALADLNHLDKPLDWAIETVVLTAVFCIPFCLPLFLLLKRKCASRLKILVISIALIPDIFCLALIPLMYLASNKAYLIPSSLYYIYTPIIVFVEIPFFYNLKNFFKKKELLNKRKMAKYENSIEHTCDIKEGQQWISVDGNLQRRI